MKTNRFNYLLMALMAMAIPFTSCSDDDDDNGGGGSGSQRSSVFEIGSSGIRLASLEHGEQRLEYEYDSNGALLNINAKDHYDEINFEFTASPFSYKEWYGDEDVTVKNVSFNGSGYIASYSFTERLYDEEDDSEYRLTTVQGTATLSYDSDGHLTKMDATSQTNGVSLKATVTLTWVGGNLIQYDRKSTINGNVDYEETISFEYEGAISNPHRQPNAAFFDHADQFFAPIGLLGKGCAQFPTRMVMHEVETYNGSKHNYDYTEVFSVRLNADGTIAEESVTKGYHYVFGYGESATAKDTRATGPRLSTGRTKAHGGIFARHGHRAALSSED